MIMTTGNYSGRVTDRGTDMMGRWSYQYLACKNNQYLVVISAYQPCKQEIKESGRIKTLTVTAQQQSMLDINNRYIKPQKAFIQDLNQLIKSIHDVGNGVLLVGDFNDCLNDKNSGMLKVQQINKLRDVMWKECGRDDFLTCIAGSKQIDYVLADD